MPINSLSYPKVCKRKDGKYYVDFKLNSKRYRLFSGRIIGSSLYPNSYPAKLRYSATSDLAKQVYEFILANNYSITKQITKVEQFDNLINSKLSEPLSASYRQALSQLSLILRSELVKKDHISASFLDTIPLRYSNNTSFNTVRRHLNVLVNYLKSRSFPIELSKLKTRKQEEVLHSPINNVEELLDRIRDFNKNLYLCCLLTYGCLLRPHQEIRLLKWKDFSDDLTLIKLTGKKVKSKRNRIVPVPLYVRENLIKGNAEDNIFSNANQPYNKSYFSLIWRRFKRLNQDLDSGYTITLFVTQGLQKSSKERGVLPSYRKLWDTHQ